MPNPEDVIQQQKLLAAYRRTLEVYVLQQAEQGGAIYALPGILNGIREARDNIRRIKLTLRGWGISVEDLPNDEDNATQGSVPRPQHTVGEFDSIITPHVASQVGAHHTGNRPSAADGASPEAVTVGQADYILILGHYIGWTWPGEGELTGQKQLLATLPEITKANEFSFETMSRLGHRYPIEHHKYKALQGFVWENAFRTPLVAFLNLSRPAPRVIDEIEYILHDFPLAIFILYADESEYRRFLNELPSDTAYKFRRFFTLRKDSSNAFSLMVRRVLDEAVLTAVRKLENIRLFSAFISYGDKDDEFAKWLCKELQEHGIRCWLDEKQLRAGDRINSGIHDAIKEHDKVLLCASKHSLTSWWIDAEINSILLKEQKLSEKYKRRVEILITIDLDGYINSEEWHSDWKSHITSRLVVQFTNWSPFHDHSNSRNIANIRNIIATSSVESIGH